MSISLTKVFQLHRKPVTIAANLKLIDIINCSLPTFSIYPYPWPPSKYNATLYMYVLWIEIANLQSNNEIESNHQFRLGFSTHRTTPQGICFKRKRPWLSVLGSCCPWPWSLPSLHHRRRPTWSSSSTWTISFVYSRSTSASRDPTGPDDAGQGMIQRPHHGKQQTLRWLAIKLLN